MSVRRTADFKCDKLSKQTQNKAALDWREKNSDQAEFYPFSGPHLQFDSEWTLLMQYVVLIWLSE